MKKYLRYKNFIPCEFINIIDNKSIVNSNKLISILLILNLAIIPNSMNKVIKKEEKDIKIEENINFNSYTKKENIELYLNQISLGIINMKIQNDNGTIEVGGKNEVYKMEDSKKIKIKSITKGNDNLFVLGVGL